MKKIVMAGIIFASLSSNVQSYSRQILRALREEKRLIQDIRQINFRIDQKRVELAMLQGVVDQYKDKYDLEEHEYIRKFKARGRVVCLESEIKGELDALRWVKMQNLGLAFNQTKIFLEEEYGLKAVEVYDQLKVAEYSALENSLQVIPDMKNSLAVQKAVQKDLLIVIAAATKELK